MKLELAPGEKVFVLTGAGVSAESGIPTFRDSNGLWEQHRVEDVASPEGFARDPSLVWRFYGLRRAKALTVEPNPGHAALAALEERLGDDLYLCTQNVDDLHERAGSRRVVHMHGELFMTRCSDESCATAPFEDRRAEFPALPRCSCGALQRPHIVWFGEMPLETHTIRRRVQACSLFLCIGSSGNVYPAAGLVRELHYRRQQGERCRAVYVGLEEPANVHEFDELVLGKSGEILPELLAP
ncbi:MAG: NAD-dependent deacylase [Kofleriaceae bacterium]